MCPEMGEPRSIKDNIRKFIEGDIPTGANMTQSEVDDVLKKKKVALVTISIKAKCGSKDLGGYERDFTVSLTPEAEIDTERVLENSMDNVKSQIVKLVRFWKQEMG